MKNFPNLLQFWDKNAHTLAYVRKKQYLCTLNRARKVYMQMIINY